MGSVSDHERSVHRLGGVAAIVGSVLAGVGNLLHPVTPEHDPIGVARVIADSGIWAPVHLVIVLGIFLMLGALIAISDSMRGGLAGVLPGSVCARRWRAQPSDWSW